MEWRLRFAGPCAAATGIPLDVNHRARARRFGVPHENINNLLVFERDGWICGLCGDPVDREAKLPRRWRPSTTSCRCRAVPVVRGMCLRTCNARMRSVTGSRTMSGLVAAAFASDSGIPTTARACLRLVKHSNQPDQRTWDNAKLAEHPVHGS